MTSGLLSEVLGIEILSVKEVKQTSIIRYKFNAIGEIRDSSINIYELAHLCKEWAYNRKYSLLTKLTNKSALCEIEDIDKTFIGYSEPDSIFNACEWLREYK
jgi:hypothetical protein